MFPLHPPSKTNRCLLSLHLFAVSFTSVALLYLCTIQKIFEGGESHIEKVSFKGATCGEVFINSKMPFRTPEKKYNCWYVDPGW